MEQTIDEILPNIYRLEIPLPRNPLRLVNSYVIRGNGRFLIIDTGQNRQECISAMRSGLAELGVDLEKTDFFITHLHADHLGLVAALATQRSRVCLSQPDIDINIYETSRAAEYWGRWNDLYLAHGFPEDELARAADTHPARRFGLFEKVDFSVVSEGDLIEIGDYAFHCIETPGHSPGHTCLYEADKKVLVSGDHILHDITPNITVWLDMDDSLSRYLKSLDRTYDLDVGIVLPGHRRPFSNHRDRIRELRHHHAARLAEARAALRDGHRTAYQVAPHISWDISVKSWDLFPPAQKWFAMGETLAHLKYLKATGEVKEVEADGHVLYALS